MGKWLLRMLQWGPSACSPLGPDGSQVSVCTGIFWSPQLRPSCWKSLSSPCALPAPSRIKLIPRNLFLHPKEGVNISAHSLFSVTYLSDICLLSLDSELLESRHLVLLHVPEASITVFHWCWTPEASITHVSLVLVCGINKCRNYKYRKLSPWLVHFSATAHFSCEIGFGIKRSGYSIHRILTPTPYTHTPNPRNRETNIIL